ncbi:protein neprosin [Elaeis guineensis]|uniref:protein neprosin n=1 Tax=Elaeis guineensis var. tenera TaxID=51953 RepID=UPI003C6D290B
MAAHISISHGLIALLLVTIYLSCAKAGVRPISQQSEVQWYLKQLNKPAIKSIKSPDGDIIDCVHISHQPAFDHHLLKNHTIQMRPTFHPLGLHDENKVESKKKTSSIAQLWHQNGRCPEHTIPIRRTKKDDVLRASSVETYGKKRHNRTPNGASPLINGNLHEHSYASVTGDKYYGTKVDINVWNPYVEEPSEFSLSQLWILGGANENLNSVEAGWQVFPQIYGDNRTTLFVYWTRDNYGKTGCYNLNCAGFVQVSNEIAVGSSLSSISSYGGPQYDITLLVWKDPQTGNWWLQFGDQSPLGYWPSSLFDYLSDSANLVEWGGEVYNPRPNGKHTATVMGSGHFAEEGYGKASCIKNIQIVDQSNNLQTPQGIMTAAEHPNCYDVSQPSNGDLGTHFFYGGPGQNPKCP